MLSLPRHYAGGTAILVMWLAFLSAGLAFANMLRSQPDDAHVIPAHVVLDKIHGGLLGQILGNLNGLPHEFKYLEEPGEVRDYIPSLPNGAWTDDDTDIEWVYIVAMQQRRELLLPPSEIVALWRKHINRRIWSSNQYVRQLFDIGIEPPYTGLVVLNPWAEFNIAGQFCCECVGLLAPGLPQLAAQIGCHYTSTVVSGEPLQATQLFTTMIAMAFITDDLNSILDAGEQALDEKSHVLQIVKQVRTWHKEHPQDWRITRRKVKETYDVFGTSHRGRNGYELNTASIIAALLYGQGDFVKTMEVAFSFGWDADCNAATAGTIIGVIKGYSWFRKQGWNIKDIYQNTCREGMPEDETISRFAQRLYALAEIALTKAGGRIVTDLHGNERQWIIPKQTPRCVRPLSVDGEMLTELQRTYPINRLGTMLKDPDPQVRARAAYLAVALNNWESLQREDPQSYKAGLKALEMFPKLVQAIYYYTPATKRAEELRKNAERAGLPRPAKRVPLW